MDHMMEHMLDHMMEHVMDHMMPATPPFGSLARPFSRQSPIPTGHKLCKVIKLGAPHRGAHH